MEKDRSLEILEAILLVNNRLGKMEERFDRIDERFDKIDERFDRIDESVGKIDERFDKLEKQVELNHTETKEEFLNVKTKLDNI